MLGWNARILFVIAAPITPFVARDALNFGLI